jgi:2-polyprenyl-3-methyl-5-hydroxy-6-metoxy-1,4-benzoquinol methylase
MINRYIKDYFEGINLSVFFSLCKGTRVLDYGCGRGAVSRFLVDQGFSVIGVDSDPSCGKMLHKNMNLDRNSSFKFYSINNEVGLLSKNIGQFDVIICREVLEHVANPNKVISTFSNILVEGGCLVLSVPTFGSENFFSYFKDSWLQDSKHRWVFRNQDIQSLLSSKRLFITLKEGQSFRWCLFWAMLVPFRVRHDMGNPISHGCLVSVVLKLTKIICSFPGLERLGNRFLPKSFFYYAIKRKPRILVVYDYQDWVLGKWAEGICKLHCQEFDVVAMSIYHAIKDKRYAAELTNKVDIVHLLLPHAYKHFCDLIVNKAVIGTVHHWVEWEEMFERTIQGSHRIVTGAKQWKQRLEEQGVLPEQITVIHSGVSDDFFKEQPPLLPKSAKLTCGFFAKMDSNEFDRKGTRHLLRLANAICEKNAQDKIRFVISGPGWSEHVSKLLKSGIETEYLPFVAEHDMPALFRSTDVYLMLSDVEGGPVTIAEAMASECLVFSTSVGVAKEIVSDKKTGLIVDSANPDYIVSMLLYYFANSEKANEIRKCARLFAEKNMRYSHTMRSLPKLYDEVLQFVKQSGEGQLNVFEENEKCRASAIKVGL